MYGGPSRQPQWDRGKRKLHRYETDIACDAIKRLPFRMFQDVRTDTNDSFCSLVNPCKTLPRAISRDERHHKTAIAAFRNAPQIAETGLVLILRRQIAQRIQELARAGFVKWMSPDHILELIAPLAPAQVLVFETHFVGVLGHRQISECREHAFQLLPGRLQQRIQGALRGVKFERCQLRRNFDQFSAAAIDKERRRRGGQRDTCDEQSRKQLHG